MNVYLVREWVKGELEVRYYIKAESSSEIRKFFPRDNFNIIPISIMSLSEAINDMESNK